MPRSRIATLAFVVLVAACRPMPASVAFDAPSSAPESIAVASADPSSVATPAPVTDPLAPSVIPGLSEVEAIDGSVVLGMTAADETVLYDLADASTTVLEVGAEARPGDLGGGFAVGALPGDDSVSGSAFVYELATRTLRTIALDHGWGGIGRIATDGRLVVGTRALTNGEIQAAWVYHLDSGKLDKLALLEGRPRGGIADVSEGRMAGTFGLDDDEKAWLYNLESGHATVLHPLFGGSLSWVNDIDGNLVVGGIQTAKPWVNQAVVYDLDSGVVVNLSSALAGASKAFGVDGSIVVGEAESGAFVYDHRTGQVHVLSGGGWARAVSGDLVVGKVGDSVVVWDIASLR